MSGKTTFFETFTTFSENHLHQSALRQTCYRNPALYIYIYIYIYIEKSMLIKANGETVILKSKI